MRFKTRMMIVVLAPMLIEANQIDFCEIKKEQKVFSEKIPYIKGLSECVCGFFKEKPMIKVYSGVLEDIHQNNNLPCFENVNIEDDCESFIQINPQKKMDIQWLGKQPFFEISNVDGYYPLFYSVELVGDSLSCEFQKDVYLWH